MNELVTIEGMVAAGFEGVRNAFEENFRSRGDRGSACAVYVEGRKVVDLWGGIADHVYVLAHGELVLAGTGRDLRARSDLFTASYFGSEAAG